MSKVHSRILYVALDELKEITYKMLSCLKPEVLDQAEFEGEMSDLISELDTVIAVTLLMRNAFCQNHDILLQDAELKWLPLPKSEAKDDTK